MTASDWIIQFRADSPDAPVDRRSKAIETAVPAAAWLAGFLADAWPDQKEFAVLWQFDKKFSPRMSRGQRQEMVAGWRETVRRTRSQTK